MVANVLFELCNPVFNYLILDLLFELCNPAFNYLILYLLFQSGRCLISSTKQHQALNPCGRFFLYRITSVVYLYTHTNAPAAACVFAFVYPEM